MMTLFGSSASRVTPHLPSPHAPQGIQAPLSEGPKIQPSTYNQAITSDTGFFSRVGNYLFPTVISSPRANQMDSSGFLFSGTSLTVLESIITLSNGALTPENTFLSTNSGLSFPYARASGRKNYSPGVMLEFSQAAIFDRIQKGHAQPVVSGHNGPPIQLGTFYRGSEEIYISELTEECKEAILDWLTDQQRIQPDLHSYWEDKINLIEAGFYPSE